MERTAWPGRNERRLPLPPDVDGRETIPQTHGWEPAVRDARIPCHAFSCPTKVLHVLSLACTCMNASPSLQTIQEDASHRHRGPMPGERRGRTFVTGDFPAMNVPADLPRRPMELLEPTMPPPSDLPAHAHNLPSIARNGHPQHGCYVQDFPCSLSRKEVFTPRQHSGSNPSAHIEAKACAPLHAVTTADMQGSPHPRAQDAMRKAMLSVRSAVRPSGSHSSVSRGSPSERDSWTA